MAVGGTRFSVRVAAVLREALARLSEAEGRERYLAFEYLRSAMSKVARVDAFYVGLLQGTGRVVFPYNYDVTLPQRSIVDDSPDFLLIGPDGPTAWLVRHRRTYRFADDDGEVLRRAHNFGDVRRPSADAVTVPFLRSSGSGIEVFGMASMHSYAPCSYDDEQVAAFEWLAGRVARMLDRGREDQESLRVLEGEAADDGLDQLVGQLTDRLRRLRLRIEHVLADPDAAYEDLAAVLGEAHGTTVLVQSQLVEALLSEDEGSNNRYQSLTPAQQGVAQLMADGLTNSEIAARLTLTTSTVKSHVAAIIRKYGMSRERAAEDIKSYLRRPDVVHRM